MTNSPSATTHPAPHDGAVVPSNVATGTLLNAWPLPLGNARVAVRALRAQDTDAFLGYRSDPEVARYQGWSTMDVAAAREFIRVMECVTGPKAGAWIQLAIALSESDLLIGDIGLWLSQDGKTAQIGYSCAQPFQRQGLTTEAVRIVIDALARFTPCETIRATIDARNVASERLLLGLAFRQSITAMAEPGGGGELAYELDLHAEPTNRGT